MKVVDVQDESITIEGLLADLSEEDVVLVKDGRVRAKLEQFDDEDWADWLFEHDPKAIRAGKAARERLRRGEGVPLDAVREKLQS